MAQSGNVELEVSTQGRVPEKSKSYAVTKVGQLAGLSREPVLFGQIRLIAESNPAIERPAIAEATLDVNGTPVRAHVAAGDLDEAVDLLEERLKRRLKRHENQLHRTGAERHRTGQGDGREWRHGDLPTQRPEWFDRPKDEREIVKQKTFALEPMTIDEAAFDLDLLGHDFYLFTEVRTGADSVICYEDDHGLVLHQAEGTARDPLDGVAAPVRVGPPAPSLALDDAIERLDAGGERWVFFVDEAAGRGTVLYHRYDGHYGQITAT